MNADPVLDPMDLFTHVYAEQTAQLREQAAMLRAELDAEAGHGHGHDHEGAGR
jgi:pyruvate dehydrogenase E1 component alpha subunit